MDNPDEKYIPGVVIGNNKAKKQDPKKKKRFLIAAALLVIVTGAGGAASYFITRNKEPEPLYTDLTDQEVRLQDITRLAETDLEKAKQQYQDLIDSQKDKNVKAASYKAKGNLCLVHEDYQCVLKSYQEADKLVGEDYYSVYSKAFAHERAGSKQAAKSGYQKALQMIQSISEADRVVEADQIQADLDRVSE